MSIASSKKLLCLVAAAAIISLVGIIGWLAVRLDGVLVTLDRALSSNSHAANAVLWSADKAVGNLDAASTIAITGIRDDARALLQETTAIAQDLRRKADQAYAIANKTNAETAAASAASYRMLRRLEVELLGEQQAHPPATQPLVAALRESIQGSSRTWASATGALNQIDSQVAATGQASVGMLKRTQDAVLHVDDSLIHLDRPVQAAAVNIEATTRNIAESTKSVDEALRPLRKAEGRLKAWLKLAAGFFRVTIPAW